MSGLLHGVCRQWDEAGRLLGKFKMTRGTGVQLAWHTNGRLQMEISTVHGQFCGRCRSWLSNGTLTSEQIYLRGRLVTEDDYRQAAAIDKSLPRIGRAIAKPARKPVTEKHIHRVFVSSLLKKRNRAEALAWLQKGRRVKGARSLGRFKRVSDAAKFAQALYDAGAIEVIAPDIYRNKEGDEFADCLLMHLPKAAAKRRAIRKVCAQLQKGKLGAVQPEEDIGESHLYLSMS